MSDFVTSLVRTYVPIIVGAVVSFLATKGINVEPEAAAGLTAFLTAVISGAYYLVVRLLESKYPAFGKLLGSSKKPEYYED